MSTLQFPAYNLSETDDQSMHEIYNTLKTSHSADFDFDFTFNFKDFELFRLYESYAIGPVIRLRKGNMTFYITFTQVEYNLPRANKLPHPAYKEYQMWGVAFLKDNFGHILIKPETILDKIHELINPIEIDFDDDKHFSRNFYVVTNDELKARMQLTPSFRNFILNIKSKEFALEIIDKSLIFGNTKCVNSTIAFEFVNFVDSLAKSQI